VDNKISSQTCNRSTAIQRVDSKLVRHLMNARAGEDVGYWELGGRIFWLRLRNGAIVAARDEDQPFSDDLNLWQAER